jgi:adenosylcobinamide-phosphate synthase
MCHPAVLLIALFVDRIIGDPDWLWRRISHPVVLFGHAIGFADRKFNRPTDRAGKRRRNGNVAIAVLLIGAAIIGGVLASLFARLGLVGMVLEVIVVAVFLAQKSLADHVEAVARGMRNAGLAGGRMRGFDDRRARSRGA